MIVEPVVQLGPGVDPQTAVATLIKVAENVEIVRWIELPASVLLLLLVPGDPDSGAAYAFDRKKGTWYSVDFEDEQFGGYSVNQREELLKDCNFLDLIERPWLSSPSPLPRWIVTRKHGLHCAKPAFHVALLERLQHSTGEKSNGVRQPRISRPRTQVVDGVGEQFGDVVHAFEWASDILGEPRCACRTLRPAATLAKLARFVRIRMEVAEASLHRPGSAGCAASSKAFAALPCASRWLTLGGWYPFGGYVERGRIEAVVHSGLLVSLGCTRTAAGDCFAFHNNPTTPASP